MKNIVKNLAEMIHQSDQNVCFAIEFWDGDTIHFGALPQMTLRLKTETCARKIIETGFIGVRDSYIMGELEIDNFLPLGLTGEQAMEQSNNFE
jgi:hypothetical protein